MINRKQVEIPSAIVTGLPGMVSSVNSNVQPMPVMTN